MNSDLLRTDEHLSAWDWPGLQKIEIPSIRAGDFLLVCAGFEDRAMEVLRRICDSGITGFSVGIVDYRPPYPENKIKEMREMARRAGLKTHEIVYDRENPAGIGEELDYQADRVFVDISGMSRLLIVQVLVELIRKQEQSINIIYSMAKEYPPSEVTFKEDQKDNGDKPAPSYLSSGIFEIATTPELSSVSMLGEAIRLIGFPSFDHSQLTNLIQELQPAYTELIHGVPPDEHNRWRTAAIKKLNQSTLKTIKGTKSHEACTFNYIETLKILLQTYAKRSMFDRLVVAPTGSKMQAVAVGLLRAFLDDVQIVYPTPHTFIDPKHYTSRVRQLHEVNIPVGEIIKKLK